MMSRLLISLSIVLFTAILGGGSTLFGQVKSQEVSEIDGLPVLLKHLPDHERMSARALFVTNINELRNIVGDEPVLDAVDFPIGTEAVSAVYPQGRLVIVEYTNPLLSSEVDARIHQHIASVPGSQFVYRRIGNYNAFVFGPSDLGEAGALLDEIKYEKTVQWLGEDPFLLQKLERYMVTTSRDIAISTVLWIALVLGSALLTGIASGLIFFRFREQKRLNRSAFSDAGGLTRLNLDGLSE
jgi:hypothetical protein